MHIMTPIRHLGITTVVSGSTTTITTHYGTEIGSTEVSVDGTYKFTPSQEYPLTLSGDILRDIADTLDNLNRGN